MGRKGRPLSAAHKAAISRALKGKNRGGPASLSAAAKRTNATTRRRGYGRIWKQNTYVPPGFEWDPNSRGKVRPIRSRKKNRLSASYRATFEKAMKSGTRGASKRSSKTMGTQHLRARSVATIVTRQLRNQAAYGRGVTTQRGGKYTRKNPRKKTRNG